MSDYTAAPIFMEEGKDAGHEWLIEFEQHPDNLTHFKEVLDSTLKEVNSDYEAKRHKDIALKPPIVRVMPKGTFKVWMQVRGKLGGQHKVPRLCNDRKIIDDILEMNNSALSG